MGNAGFTELRHSRLAFSCAVAIYQAAAKHLSPTRCSAGVSAAIAAGEAWFDASPGRL